MIPLYSGFSTKSITGSGSLNKFFIFVFRVDLDFPVKFINVVTFNGFFLVFNILIISDFDILKYIGQGSDSKEVI